jgi:hypothetical protein
LIGFVVAAVGLCRAADQPISGAKLSITRSSSGTERLTFTSKDVHVLFPALGGADDPSVVGATITLVSPAEVPVTLAIPAGVGNPGWRLTDRTLDRYKFSNGAAPGGPSVVRQVSLRENRGLKIVARETGLALAAAQGSVGIRFTTGSLRSCARFDGSAIVVDQPGRFIGKGAAATLADCDDASLGATTTTTTLGPLCGNGVIDSGESCDGANLGTVEPGLGCFPPGSADECHYCGAPRCRFPLLEIPCCDPTKTCVASGPNSGDCLGPGEALCGNGMVEPGESCDAFACDATHLCSPPGDPNECQCCGVVGTSCWDINLPPNPGPPCCAGLTCAHFPPGLPGGPLGPGLCASTCAPLGTECESNGLPCCTGTCVQPDPEFPHSFCQ